MFSRKLHRFKKAVQCKLKVVIQTEFTDFSFGSRYFTEEGALLWKFHENDSAPPKRWYRNRRFSKEIYATCGYFSKSETIRLISDKNFIFWLLRCADRSYLISFLLRGRRKMESQLRCFQTSLLAGYVQKALEIFNSYFFAWVFILKSFENNEDSLCSFVKNIELVATIKHAHKTDNNANHDHPNRQSFRFFLRLYWFSSS